MKTFVGKSSEFSQRSFASSDSILAAGEVKGRTASGPMIVLPRTITTEGSFNRFLSTATSNLAQDTQQCGAGTDRAWRRAKRARDSHRSTPLAADGVGPPSRSLVPTQQKCVRIVRAKRVPEHRTQVGNPPEHVQRGPPTQRGALVGRAGGAAAKEAMFSRLETISRLR